MHSTNTLTLFPLARKMRTTMISGRKLFLVLFSLLCLSFNTFAKICEFTSKVIPSSIVYPAQFGDTNGSFWFEVVDGVGPFTVTVRSRTNEIIQPATVYNSSPIKIYNLPKDYIWVEIYDSKGCHSMVDVDLLVPPPMCEFTSKAIPASIVYPEFGNTNGSFWIQVVDGVGPFMVTVHSRTNEVIQPAALYTSNTIVLKDLPKDYIWIFIVDSRGCHSMVDVDLLVPPPMCEFTSKVTPSSIVYPEFGNTNGSFSFQVVDGVGPFMVTVHSRTNEVIQPAALYTSNTIVLKDLPKDYIWIFIVDSRGCHSMVDVDLLNPPPPTTPPPPPPPPICMSCGKKEDKKVMVCHNDGNYHDICISVNALSAHIPGHPGDYCGPCREEDLKKNKDKDDKDKKDKDDKDKDNKNNKSSVSGAESVVVAKPIDEASALSELSITAGPNPFHNSVKFVIQSKVSGHAELILFNSVGAKVGTPFNGYVSAGRSQTVEYRVPSTTRGSLFYVIKQGKNTRSGKLMAE